MNTGNREKEFESLKESIFKLYEKNEFIKLPVSSVFDYLEECYGKLPANENSLRNYIHYLIETNQMKTNNKSRYYTKVSELPYGKQMQLDFGEIKNGEAGKLYIFGTVLCKQVQVRGAAGQAIQYKRPTGAPA